MEEQREESDFVGDCREPMEETGKGLGLSSEAETLDGEFDIQELESCIEDANAIQVSGLGVCDVSVTAENPDDGGSASEDDNSNDSDEVECEGDAAVEVEPIDEIEGSELCNETVKLVEVVESENGGSHEIAGEEKSAISGGNEKEICEIEDNGDAEQNVQTEKSQQSLAGGEMLSAAENEADQGKESTERSEEVVDSEQEEKEEKVGLSYNEQGSSGCETADAKHSESAQVPEEPAELSNGESNEENGEGMEIDYAAEEQVGDDVEVGGALDNGVNESAGATVVQIQVEADENDSSVVNEMEIDEEKENVGMATDLTDPNSPSEDAATGNIQDLKTETNVSLKEDKKAIDLPEEVATVDCKEALKSGDATVNAESHDNLSLSAEGIQNEESPAAATECPREASDAIMESDENQEEKVHEGLDQQDAMREEDDTTHEAPSIEPNQKGDTEMEENPDNSDYGDDGTDSDIKTNGVKRKADVLSEDSPDEGRKTVSVAKVSFAHRPSFKIGAGIARAASQMAGSPSVLKGGNIGEETLSVESFVSQLHCAATDPVKENVVSESAAGFFLEFRNSSASQEAAPEKVGGRRGRPSNSNAGGTEAFEFEEMGDTYWTDRVIHNGGEEQTPATEKGDYQVVPVELKPAQVKRTRRPYKRRQSQISIPLPSASDKPADFDENAPAELIMNFSETDTIPSEKSLSKMFRHFGPIRESLTEVDQENNRARVVYRKGTDAEVAYNSAGRFSIFGAKAVNYELRYTITEAFKVQPYVVSLGEEDAALCLPS
ncbi:unnamed protein product [Microthlaspi erraticum]|uniref:Uncharacterized protein n=1 Tax=Microthlaspi erraticum TaxID=1685480 RepID=A0A6D2KCL5_9BRAS|nr:unnamed protein product [Microthlaspi erraticum]